MNRVLTITRVELVRFLRERGNVFFVFVLPLGLVLFIGLQFGAGGGGPQLGVVSPGDAGALALVERIDAGEAEVVEVDDAAELESLVSRGNLSAGIVIPAGYGAALEQAQPIDVGFVGRPDARAASLRTVVEAAIAEQAAAPEAARTVASVTGEEPAALLETAQEVAASLPRLEVVTTAVGGDELAAEFAGLGQFDLGATSQLFLFVFLTSLAGSAALIQARQYGVATRMLSTPTRLPTIVSGLVGGRLAIAGFQAVYIIVVTAVAFRVDWGDPLATGAVVPCSASLRLPPRWSLAPSSGTTARRAPPVSVSGSCWPCWVGPWCRSRCSRMGCSGSRCSRRTAGPTPRWPRWSVAAEGSPTSPPNWRSSPGWRPDSWPSRPGCCAARSPGDASPAAAAVGCRHVRPSPPSGRVVSTLLVVHQWTGYLVTVLVLLAAMWPSAEPRTLASSSRGCSVPCSGSWRSRSSSA
jgi:hypothetical protein